MTLTRKVPLIPEQSALLFVDVQNFSAHKKGTEFVGLSEEHFKEKYGWYFDELESRIVEFSPDASELTPWVEVVVEGAIFGDELSSRVRELAEGKDYEILKVLRVKTENDEGGAILADGEDYEFVLDHPDQVFERLLDQKEVTDEAERERLKVLFGQVVGLVEQAEGEAE